MAATPVAPQIDQAAVSFESAAEQAKTQTSFIQREPVLLTGWALALLNLVGFTDFFVRQGGTLDSLSGIVASIVTLLTIIGPPLLRQLTRSNAVVSNAVQRVFSVITTETASEAKVTLAEEAKSQLQLYVQDRENWQKAIETFQDKLEQQQRTITDQQSTATDQFIQLATLEADVAALKGAIETPGGLNA